jgi:hypothetical protein
VQGICIGVLVILTACRGPGPYAASTNRRLTEAEQNEKLVLNEAERAAVLAAMREVATDAEPTNPPTPQPSEIPRWSDLASAAVAACDEIEAAIVDTVHQADGESVIFALKTVEGWPGELSVERVPPPEVYRATARIGRFPAMPDRMERTERLLEALDRFMLAYAAKPKLPGGS